MSRELRSTEFDEADSSPMAVSDGKRTLRLGARSPANGNTAVAAIAVNLAYEAELARTTGPRHYQAELPAIHARPAGQSHPWREADMGESGR